MEAFGKLSWRINDPSTLDIGTNFIKEENVEKLFMLQDAPPKFESLITKTNDNKKKSYPSESCLNKQQHEQCLRALQLLELNKPLTQYNQQEQQIINIYNNLKLQIHEENKLFLTYVEERWKEELFDRAKCKLKNAGGFIKKRLNFSFDEIKNYDQFYEENKIIPLSCLEKIVHVNYEASVLDLGSVANIRLPSHFKFPKLSFNRFPSVKLIQENAFLKEEELKITKLPISKDIYAEDFAKLHNCDIVISSSGLKTIIDNYGPDFNSEWTLPIIVKEYNINGKNKSIAFVDKAFPKQKPNWRNLITKFTKFLLKTNLCQQLEHTFPTPEGFKQKYISNENTNVENPAKKIKLDDTESTDHYFDYDFDQDNNEPSKHSSQNKIEFYHNVSYRIWNLKLQEEKHSLLKGASNGRDIRILIRCKLDGSVVNDEGTVQPVTLVPKLEYQWEHGAEMITHSEILRQWTSLFFRPYSMLWRMRIHCLNGNIMKTEHINSNKVVAECIKGFGSTPTAHLTVLYNVLANICDLRNGNYVLHHTPKHGPFAALLKSVSDSTKSSFDLSTYYKKPLKIDDCLNWNPIDPTIVLQIHIDNKLTPGMFPPRGFKNMWKILEQPGTGKSKKKKKKKGTKMKTKG